MMNDDRLSIRYTEKYDAVYLYQWIKGDDLVMQQFFADYTPQGEVAFVLRWISNALFFNSITLCLDGIPIGIGTLWLNDLKKISHHCMFGMIISPEARGRQLGVLLCDHIIRLADKYFNMEQIYLQVMKKNVVAINLYKKFGFRELVTFKEYLLEEDGSRGDVITMRKDIKK